MVAKVAVKEKSLEILEMNLINRSTLVIITDRNL